MRPLCLFLIGWLPAVCPLPAAEPRSPLSVIPDEADLVLAAPNPNALLDAAIGPELFRKFLKLAPAREFLEGTAFSRFQQLVAYLEREMGQPLPKILDQVAGGGLALAARLGPEPAPVLLVLEGRDEKASARFFALLGRLVEQELARQEGAPKLTRGSYEGAEGFAIGKDVIVVHAGTTLLLSNRKEAMVAAIHLLQGKSDAYLGKKPAVQEARKLLPESSLVWMWLDMERVRQQNPAAAEFYKSPREPLATMLFGSYFDLLGRTPFVALALGREKEDIALHVRLPVGREGMGPDRLLHVGPDGRPASRPLLEPRGVLFSTSFHLDLASFWNDRAKIFAEDVVRGLEEADRGLKQFPLNRIQISKMLTATAPYHRLVAVVQPKGGYTKQPTSPVPAFALTIETTGDDFAGGIETLVRGAGLALIGRFRTRMHEEKMGDVTLLGYRLDENQVIPEDVNDFRFAFSPCFARVGNQVLLCSTLELGREMVALLQAEKPGERAASAETRFYGTGFAELLALQEDQLITQAILDQAVPASEARQQVRELLALLRSSGGVSLRATYRPRQFEYEMRLRLK